MVADCSVFDPAPFELTEGTEIPLELAIRILESPLSFEEATEAGENEEFRSGTEETTVAGLDALRIIAESTGGPTTPEGTTIYRYVIDVPGEGVLIAATYDVEGNRFRLANEVLDAMMDTFELQQ